MATHRQVARARAKMAAVARQPVPADGDLGELGKAKGGPVELSFGWFGTRIRVNPGAGELELVDFLTEAQQVDVPDNPEDLAASTEALKVVLDFLRRQIHPDDWAVWWDLAKTNRQTTMDLMEVAMVISEKVAGFPTGPSSASPGGRAATQQKSTAGLSSQATSRALELLSGRPDLQHAVLQAAQAD